MTRRFGRLGAGARWLTAAIALLCAVNACGDDDGDEGAGDGTGGASGSGGMRASSGGASGGGGTPSGGRSGSGGSSGGVPTGGSAGSTSGGVAAVAGEGGLPGEGGGGPFAGAGDGGSAGDGGAGGGAEVSVEYRSCERGAAVTRLEIYRIDRSQGTCTYVVVQQGQINCLEGLKSGGWCVIGAAISDDVEACEAVEMPSNALEATAGEGTFTISTQPLAISIDVRFDFPASNGLPESVSVEADDCVADCATSDCRP